MTETTTPRLRSRSDEARGQRLLTLDVPEPLRRSHVAPGQVVVVQSPAGPGYFALCNAPGEPWQVLVKGEAGRAAAFLASLDEGAALDVSAAQGAGFRVDGLRPTAVLVAGGTGIAPVWPLARALVEMGRRPRVLVSAATVVDHAFVAPLRAMRDAGHADVALFASREAAPPEPFVAGRCTAALGEGAFDPAGVTVFLAGPSAMVKDLAAMFAARGVSAEHVRRNY